MIDAHCHLNASYTANTVSPIIDHFTEKGGTKIIDVSTSLEDISMSQLIINRFPKTVFSTIGIHPETVKNDALEQQHILENFEEMANKLSTLQNIVGIGETGFDYYYFDANIEHEMVKYQEELFRKHIALAQKWGLPLVIHARSKDISDMRAYQDSLTALKAENFSGKVYFHSFGGNTNVAEKLLELDYYLGINGIVTYKGAQNISDTVTMSPLTSLVLETDAPFLIPSNMDRSLLQDKTINEPMAIFFTAKRIAALKKIAIEDVLSQTERNTSALFERML